VPNSGLPALPVQQDTSSTGLLVHTLLIVTGYWLVNHAKHWHAVVQQIDERAKQRLACRVSTPQVHMLI
jgi:hypothetical protein